jgi:flagellar assembly protein FliH
MAGVISRNEAVLARPWRLQELFPGVPPAEPPAPPEAEAEPIVLPTIAELEDIRAKAFDEGFISGRQEAIGQMTGEIRALAQGLAGMSQQMATVDAMYERFFAEVGRAIADIVDVVPPAQLAQRVQRALGTIARPEQMVLCLHPEDAASLREVAPEVLAQPGLSVSETGTISRGGFAIRTPFGEVDATLESAIAQLKKALQDVSV